MIDESLSALQSDLGSSVRDDLSKETKSVEEVLECDLCSLTCNMT